MLTAEQLKARVIADTTSSAYKAQQKTMITPGQDPAANLAARVAANAPRVAAMQTAAAPQVAQIKANTAMINAGQTPTAANFQATKSPTQVAMEGRAAAATPSTGNAFLNAAQNPGVGGTPSLNNINAWSDAQQAAQDLGIGTGVGNQTVFGNQSFYTGMKDNSVTDLKPPLAAGTKGVGGDLKTTEETSGLTPYAGMETVESVQAKAEQEFWGKQEADATKYQEELIAKTKAETDANMQSWDASMNPQYQQKLTEAENNTNAAIEDMMRFAGAKGSSRSSRTMDAMTKIQDKGNLAKDAILAEKEREREMYQMQLAGASDEALAAAGKAVQDAKEKRIGAEAVVFAAQQGILLEQRALAASEDAQRKSEYADYLESVGMTMDPTTGETVQSMKGQIDMASIQKNLASAKKTQAEASKLQKALENPDMKVEIGYDGAGNQIFQWYDPAKPGEYQTFKTGITKPVGSTGGGGGSGGGGGGGSGGGGSGSSSGGVAEELANSDLTMQDVLGYIAALPGTETQKNELFNEVYGMREVNQSATSKMNAGVGASMIAGNGMQSSSPQVTPSSPNIISPTAPANSGGNWWDFITGT